MANAFSRFFSSAVHIQSKQNQCLIAHVTSTPPPRDKPPMDHQFEKLCPNRKSLSIIKWINCCTKRARLFRLFTYDTVAYMKLALTSISGDFEVLNPVIRNNLDNLKNGCKSNISLCFLTRL